MLRRQVNKNNMSLILVIGGVAGLIYGTLTVLGFTKNDISNNSDWDKKFLSESTRYFMGRYYAGFGLMATGVGAIVLGLILHFSR